MSVCANVGACLCVCMYVCVCARTQDLHVGVVGRGSTKDDEGVGAWSRSQTPSTAAVSSSSAPAVNWVWNRD